MQLKKAQVQNFKSVEDSGEILVDQVTCFIGKNEAGKTALLEALHKLNPLDTKDGTFDEEDYPRRRLATLKQREEREPLNVLTTTWTLSDEEVGRITSVAGAGALTNREVVITKGYEDEDSCWTFDVDEKAIAEHLVESANLNAAEKAPLSRTDSVSDLSSPW